MTVAVDDATETAVTWAAVCDATGDFSNACNAEENVEAFWSKLSLVEADEAPLKKVTQFVAIVFAVPVRLAGMPGDEPADELDDVADTEAAGTAGALAGDGPVGAEVAGVGAGADEPELLHAASARQLRAAAAMRSDPTLDRVFIERRPPEGWLRAE
ncbi:MAG TPA: hypothetical protein VMG38_19400 [Trebonia sp.]|nr:hypothetical protein [Trebonia sp.]